MFGKEVVNADGVAALEEVTARLRAFFCFERQECVVERRHQIRLDHVLEYCVAVLLDLIERAFYRHRPVR